MSYIPPYDFSTISAVNERLGLKRHLVALSKPVKGQYPCDWSPPNRIKNERGAQLIT